MDGGTLTDVVGWGWWIAGAWLCASAGFGFLTSLRAIAAAVVRAEPRRDLPLVAAHQSLLLAILAGAPLLGLPPGSGSWGLRLGGALLTLAGHAVNARLGARTLGMSLTPFAELAGPLVTTGPYALVRHPMYAGQMMLAVGAPLLFARPDLLVVAAAALVALVARALREERALAAGEPRYAAYARRTKRFIPCLF